MKLISSPLLNKDQFITCDKSPREIPEEHKKSSLDQGLQQKKRYSRIPNTDLTTSQGRAVFGLYINIHLRQLKNPRKKETHRGPGQACVLNASDTQIIHLYSVQNQEAREIVQG